ncbi:MAG TPA: FecR domain-containing protein, partial [Polyangiaceae bacterium]|nr:FecR domain-containing protein [Polyangiaceae bacterium]
MRPTLAEPADPRALTDLTELARNSVQRPTKAELNQGLNTLYSRISEDNFRGRVRVRWSQVGAVALVLTLVILPVAFYLHQRALPALAYQIEGGRVIEGGYLREAGNGGMKVSFNEGSRLELTPGTRGRVRAIDREGARFAIDSGTASFRVTPGNGRQWWVEVGPFLVTVKGTVFSVSWDPPTEHFELILRQGRVLVSGPVSGGELTLRAGQRLLVSLPKAETLITENAPEEARGSTVTAPALAQSVAIPAPPQPSPEKPDSSAPSTAPAPPSTTKTERRWADELA